MRQAIAIPEFLRFLIVGGIGFVSDAGLYAFLLGLGLEDGPARGIAILIALHVTFYLHGIFTFQHHDGFSIKSWFKFMGANLAGAFVNLFFFILTMVLIPSENVMAQRVVSVLIGTAAAMGLNYWLNRRYVFTATPDA